VETPVLTKKGNNTPWEGSDGTKLPVSAWLASCTPAVLARMPRKLRLEYAGAMYRIMTGGDQRQEIFLCDVERHLIAEQCG